MTAAPASAAPVCRLIVPTKVVLRAIGSIQNPYRAGARWSCPANVRANGYRDEFPDYDNGHPISWAFGLTAGTRVPKFWSNSVWFTSFHGETPQLGATGTGGDASPITPGRYRAWPQSQYGPYTYTNYPGVQFTSTPGFVAKYWSKATLAVTRSRGAVVVTTVHVVGRRDTVVNVHDADGWYFPQGRMNVAANGFRVVIYRDGKGWRTLTLDSSGTATLRIRDTRPVHAYRAVMLATAMNWPAGSTTVRR